ncbi:hypothetical protein BDF14DRAFT_1881829 [Spinellus fusiger]|nr:hypothetical protein BDF14DRAFT_1881829 [Spinellus fusiger]
MARDYPRHPKRTIVMTGGDSGIGHSIVQGLLVAGFHVILVSYTSRDECPFGNTTLKEVTWVKGDLSSYESVHTAAKQIKAIVPQGHLYGIINNAGIMNVPYQKTRDGFEAQHQVNYLSPILLTLLIIPWIEEDGCVLFTSSSTFFATSEIDMSMVHSSYTWDGLRHYSHSKLCLAYMTRVIAKQLTRRNSGTKVYTYHPGTVRTGLFSHTSLFSFSALRHAYDFLMLSPKEGSRTPLFLCLQRPQQSGYYWSEEAIQKMPKIKIKGRSLKEEEAFKEVWSHTMDYCGFDQETLAGWTC